ncbi:MAG: T9SS type A sorting domain-containing protein [Flavobacteriales bacterium]|nr:T9SS type A sorting domain-containing protein [Flavobacteriales bacterium]
MKHLLLVFLAILMACSTALSQRSKDGAGIAPGAGTVVNAYTALSVNANAGATSITVLSNTLGTNFAANLTAGDLIFIYQTQGADILGVANGNIGNPNDATWGDITAYNDCGNYEFSEVIGVTGGTGITLSCGLANDYTALGKVQIVRVPRYSSLMVGSGTSIVCAAWNGTSGGIVVIEVDGSVTVNGFISASAAGFRGGVLDAISTFSPNWTGNDPDFGAEKGESIAGSVSDYDGIGGRYCRAAPANGGGGGNAHNCGGGGGANGAATGITWSGYGCVDATYNASWNLEASWLVSHCRAGGGRGGYGHSSVNANATLIGPGNSAWGGDWRRPYGGQGGRVLDYASGKLFFGGGGGSGDQNNGDGGGGGAGGGLVYIRASGNVSGSGSIVANGGAGYDTDASNPPFGGYSGNDGAGGGGGGGTVIINTDATVSGVSLRSSGGDGGDQLMAAGAFGSITEAEGPGAGGGGGYIAISSGSPSRSAWGGSNGVTFSPQLTEFPPNGATSGGPGQTVASIDNYYVSAADVSTCSGASSIILAIINGTAPVGTTVGWFDAEVGGTLFGTGTSYNTPSLTTNSTYYVGLCPGHHRIAVNVTVNPLSTLNQSPVVTCDSAQIAGNWYYASQTVTDVFSDMNGCDSTVITPLVIGNTSGAETIVACGDYTWTANSTLYSASGSYTATLTNVAGCDSITTLNLTIKSATSGSETVVNCGDYTWAANSTLYTISGSYSATLINSAGCDSIATLDLTINGATAGTDVQSACLDFTWIDGNTYTSDTNSALFTITNAAGCDSIVTLDLTFGTVNVAVTQVGNILSAASGATSYQWLNCLNGMAVLLGDTNDVFTAISNGSYAVAVTDGACIDTSACFILTSVAIVENSLSMNLVVYPNPTSGYLTVDIGTLHNEITATLRSITGQVISINKYNAVSQFNLELLGASGTYFLEIVSASGDNVVIKVLKL